MNKVDRDKELGIKEKLKAELNVLDEEIADKLIVDYGVDIVNMIKDRPYILSHYLISMEIVKETIEKCSANRDEDYKNRNIVAAAIIYMIEAMAEFEGHVFCYKSELEDRIKELDEYVVKNELEKALELLENDNEIIRDTNKEGRECIYLSRLYEAEVELVNSIAYFGEANKNHCCDLKKVDEFIDSYCSADIKLNKTQQEAVRMALISRISVITGVAGSGKTTAIKAIVEGFKYLKEENIQLASFTGKAVERVSSITGIQGSTIHRLLGIGLDGSSNVQSVNADVLIIEEAGMTCLKLFKMLLDSVKDNKNIKIVIVGDEFQLQSIAPGSVLKDLIRSGIIPVVCLQDVVRQGKDSLIISNAHKIIKGIEINGKKSGIRLKKNEFEFIEADGKNIKEKVIGVIDKLLNGGTSVYDIQVMSPVKKGANGVEELNREIADRFNYIQERDIYKFGILDSVTVIRNNYTKGTFNGQRGWVKRVEKSLNVIELIMVDFCGREVSFNKNEIGDIELSFVSTVHKIQGSESKVAIMVVDREHERMINRELLYVGVTRGIERAVIVGNKEAFNEGVKRKSKERHSLLAERLIELRKQR